MRGFLDDLEQRLTLAARPDPEPAAEPQSATRAVRRPSSARFGSALGGAALAAAAIGVALTVGHPTAHALPVFERPTTNVDRPGVRASFPRGVAKELVFEDGRAFETPAGKGYVIRTSSNDHTCVAIPDPSAPDTFGSTCGPTAEVREHGLLISAVAQDSSASLTALVVPYGRVDVSLERETGVSSLNADGGVAVVESTAPATLRWTANGRVHRRRLSTPQTPRAVTVMCSDGTSRALPLDGTAPAPTYQELQRLRATACE